MQPVRYTIRPARPEAHLFEVHCTVPAPHPDGQRFSLPAWIPGSYMIRDFARHILGPSAVAWGQPVPLTQLDKHTWQAAKVPKGVALTLSYEVYAWDLSVRAAHLDATHAFFNGSSVFLAVEGQTDTPCLVDILPPETHENWRVATTLPRAEAKPFGFGLYRAAHYDELIDHPVEMGNFTLAHFEAGGLRHDIVLTGRHDCDLSRLKADLARICQWQIELFGALPPMERYLFLTQLIGAGFGGLEHRASCALIASRDDLPYLGMPGTPEGYKNFLGLCSHEYFHLWNVKHIKPAAFVPYELTRENYTRLLWAFEGFTSYYDDLALVRSGVIGQDDYLELLAKNISQVLKTPGRRRQSVAESSFNAWTHYYRQDENSPNAIVSYYTKGAMIALALDLRLRAESRRSLDDVMRVLWQQYGRGEIGVPEDGIFAAVEQIGGARLGRWLRNIVEGTDDLPLAKWLKPFGLRWQLEADSPAPTLGIKLAAGKDGDEVRIATVYEGGPAQRAGLSAGDVLIALDGLRADRATFNKQLERRSVGERIVIHAFRRDELMRFVAKLAAAPKDKLKLGLDPRAGKAAEELRRGWLMGA